MERYLGKEVVAFICKIDHRLKLIKWDSKGHLEAENFLRIRRLFKTNYFYNLKRDYEKIINSILFEFVANKNDAKDKLFRSVEREQVLKFLQEQGFSIESDQGNRNYNVPFPPLTKPAYSLIGRMDVIQDLKRLLFAEQMYRSVALCGLPGVGKTALAIEVAHDPEVSSHFCDGILWTGPGLHPDVLTILGEWAVTVGIPREEVASLTSVEARAKAIRAAIRERRMLLIIDDVWQIEAATALQVGGPNCAHLVTTRLPIISQQFALANNTISVQELSENDSVHLLEQLIPKVVYDEPDEARNLAQVVGGLPLALILSGKYLLRHSAQPRRLQAALEHLHSVQERLRLAQPQAPLERHPSLPLDAPLSLQAVIQISVDELDEASTSALHALSVFPPKPNTFSEEAALAIAATSVDTLDNLYDYGLLENGEPDRYMLHQIITDYAQLNCNDKNIFYRRMTIFFADLIKQHEIEKKYEIEYDGLDLEIINILTAIQSASERGLEDVLVRSVNTSYRFLETRGLYYMLETYLLQAERIAYLSNDVFEQEFALYHLGRISNRLGRYEKATEYLYPALILAHQRKDIDQTVNILGNISEAYLSLQDNLHAEHYALESLSLSDEFGLERASIAGLVILGGIYIEKKDYTQAEMYYREALEKAKSLDSYSEMSPLFSNLGLVTTKQGDYSQAEAYFQEALAIALRAKNYEHVLTARINIINTAHKQGKYEIAEGQLRQVLEIANSIKNRRLIHAVIGCILNVSHDCSDYMRAKQYLQEGITLTFG